MLDRPHLRLIALVGLIVPRRLRTDWRQEWEAELRYREALLADWDRLDWRHRLDLLRRSSAAFRDALWLQSRRLEDGMFQDLRFAFRMLLKAPGFALIAVLTLALGIGANTAIFTLLDKLLIRPLPVERPNELVTFVRDAGGSPAIFSYPQYTDFRERSDLMAGLAAYFQRPFSLTDGAHSERVIAQFVSGNYFSVLGVQPALGRFFLPEEDAPAGTHPVVVISHGLWRRRFAADPAVIGAPLGLNGQRCTVIGVAPSEFTGTTRATMNDVYVPTMMVGRLVPGNAGSLTSRNWGWLSLIGRLKPGVTRDQAQRAFAIMANEGQPATTGKKSSSKNAFVLGDGSRGHTSRVSDLSRPLQLLMGAVGLVLLIACANVANLLLARSSTRQKEIVVRMAIGANRTRIVRQLLTEGTILAVLGGVFGLLIAYWFSGLLPQFQQQTNFVPRTLDGSLDGRALAFTAGLSMLAGLAFSMAPALHATKPDFVSALKRDAPAAFGGARWFSLRSLLVVVQVALSLVVLIGAALCAKSLRTLHAIDPGFEPAKVVTASFDLRTNGYDEPRGKQLMANMTGRVAALPGVEAVSFATIVAFSDLFWVAGAAIEDYVPQPGERFAFDFNAVSPEYFRTLGVPLLEGREFTPQDAEGAPPVVIVNEAVARRYWPGQHAVGKRTSRGEVVGVVRNTKEKGLTQDPTPTIYLPLLQGYVPELTLHVRSAVDPATLIAGVRREIQSLDATLPVYNLRTLADQKEGSLHTQRLAASVLTLFAALALIVAAVGLYGVLSYAVTERTREMGIRRAHGAQTRDLIKLVVGQGMLLTAVGLSIGVGASFALTRVIQQLLFGVSATDPLTFVVIPLLLAAVALLACWIPARRATRMDAVTALRYE